MSYGLHLLSAENNECIFKTKIKSWRIRKLENTHTHTHTHICICIYAHKRERERSETVFCTPKTSTKLQMVELQYF